MKNILTERSTGHTSLKSRDDKFIVSGRFGLCDTLNNNGRIYSRRLWECVLNRPEIKHALKSRTMVGELGHPEDIETTPVNISHIVTELRLLPNGEVYGEAEILDTPSGRILKTLYEAGVEMGISSRGYLIEGYNLFPDEHNNLIVPEEGYDLITFDFVIDPSTPGANPTLKESAVKELSTLLTENRNRVNPDIASFIQKQEDRYSHHIGPGFTSLKESSSKKLPPKLSKKNPSSKTPASGQTEARVLKATRLAQELKDRLLVSEDIIEDLVNERNELMEEVQNTRSENAKLMQKTKTLSRTKSDLRESDDLIREQDEHIKMLENKLRGLLQSSDDESSKLEEQLNKAHLKFQEISELKTSRYREAMQENAVLEKRNNHLMQESSRLIRDNRNLISENRSLKKHMASLQSDNNTMKADICRLKEQNQTLRNKNASMRSAYKRELASTTEATRRKADRTNTQLREENESLKALVARKDAALQAPVRINESKVRNLASEYHVSPEQVKRIMRSCATPEKAAQYFLQNKRKTVTEAYSEYPFMRDPKSEPKNVPEHTLNEQDSHLARIIERQFSGKQ